MDAEDFSKRPLVEQIYDELFANIEKHNEFDEGVIETIKQLAANGELKKHGKVIEALKEMGTEKDETTRTGN
jgi:hemerythrin